MSLVARLVREPLIHFLVIGAALFGLYGLIGEKGSDAFGRVVVSESRVARIADDFSQARGRPPTRAELGRLVEAHVRDEVFYREAVKRAVDCCDGAAGRRASGRKVIPAEPVDASPAPTDTELTATLEAHREEFHIGTKIAFEQIQIDSETANALARALAVLEKARASPSGTDFKALGDSSPLPFRFGPAPVRSLARTLGEEWTKVLAGLQPGEWGGPLKSVFGLHVVRLTERIEGYDPPLDEVRAALERKWRAERRDAARSAEYARLRKAYEIILPPSLARDDTAAPRNPQASRPTGRYVAVSAPDIAPIRGLYPCALEIRQETAERYAFRVVVPTRDYVGNGLRLHLPEMCWPLSTLENRRTKVGFERRRTIVCPGGLIGKRIGFDGPKGAFTDVIVRAVRSDGSVQSERLTPDARYFVFRATPTAFEAVRVYFGQGFWHFLRGADHLLFVLAFILLAASRWSLIKAITAFTLAHSVTMTFSTLGWAGVPTLPVEAAIALCVAFVATEAIRPARAEPGPATRLPWIMALAIGLLHGFGNTLREAGPAANDVFLALAGFNLGVEAGQLIFVALVLVLAASLDRLLAVRLPPLRGLAAYGIGSVAAAWFLQRLVAMI